MVIIQKEDGQVLRYAFADSPVRLGRSPLNDLQLDDPFVSRWEGILRFDARSATYFNVGATNTTLVNGEPAAVHHEVEVTDRTELRIGSLTLRFGRAPVPEAVLRRKGARKPPHGQGDVPLATAIYDPEVPGGHKPKGPAPRTSARAVTAEPPVVSLEGGAGSAPRPASPGATTFSEVPSAGREPSPWHDQALREQDDQALREQALREAYDAYRAAWKRLFSRLADELSTLPPSLREARTRALLERYPRIAGEPEFEALLLPGQGRFPENGGSPGPAQDNRGGPELDRWFQEIATGHAPPGMVKKTPKLGRILAFAELLTESLVELHAAQDTVRRHWFGLSSRASPLRSNDPRRVLSYMLHPEGDWPARVQEFKSVIQELVSHELALLNATLVGAKVLLQRLSPEQVAKLEGVKLAPLASSSGGGVFGWLGAAAEQRLFRRYRIMYSELVEEKRYQREFLGRAFRRTYLAALGRGAEEHQSS